MAPLPPRDQRHLWLHYQVEGYTEEIVHDFKYKAGFGRESEDGIYWGRFSGGGARHSMTWRQFILDLGLHTSKEIVEDEFSAYWLGSERVIPDKGDLSDYWVEISSGMEFFRGAPSYTYIRDLVQRLYHRLISYSISGRGQAPKKVTATHLFYLRSMDRGAANVSYLLAQYLFKHVEGRKSDARLSRGHFIGCIAHHFGLVNDDGLRGLSFVTRELLLINMGKGAKRQPVAAAAAPGGAKDALDVDEGAQAIPAPIHAPPPTPPATGLVERLMTDQGRFSTWMVSYMTQLMKASGRTYQAFDGTFRGSYPAVFERRTRRRTDGASTSTAQQDDQQPDP
ncbi:hypothetical protein Tco_0260228 [Tanacetum coccineum]